MTSKMNWVDVRDNLPEELEPVLAWIDYSFYDNNRAGFFVAHYDSQTAYNDTGYGAGWVIYDPWVESVKGKITHWTYVQEPKRN